jgi:hypothetical protein
MAPAQESRVKESKGPRGLYVFSDQLKEVFPYARVKGVTSTIYHSLKDVTHSNTLYLVTVSEFMPVLADLQALKDFAREGNDVLIFCHYLNQEARDFFDVADTVQFNGEADSIKLEKDGQWVMGHFSSKIFDGFEGNFAEIHERRATVLGRNGNGKANFLRIKYGSGSVYIHLLPEVLTNYFLLEKENYKYTQAMLSYMPKNTEQILWKQPRYRRNNTGSQAYNGKEESEFSFMSVIWNNDNLRWAFLLGLFVLFLLLLFGSKRKQRIIPVIQPVQNTTFEFAQTMGDLYFNQHNNNDIAGKKIKYWQEHVRNHYNLSTREMNREFWDHLGKKSGQPQEVLKNLELAVVRANNANRLSDRDLVHLSNSIDRFYLG